MTTWKRGREIVGERLRARAYPFAEFLKDIAANPPHRVPGTAVFMTGTGTGTPPALLHNLEHNKVLHEQVVLLTVITADVPHVRARGRAAGRAAGRGLLPRDGRVRLHGGPGRPRRARRARRARAPRRSRDDDVLPRPRDAAGHRPARDGRLARAAVRADVEQRDAGDDVLQHSVRSASWSWGCSWSCELRAGGRRQAARAASALRGPSELHAALRHGRVRSGHGDATAATDNGSGTIRPGPSRAGLQYSLARHDPRPLADPG